MSGYSRLSGSTRIRSDQLACFLSVKTPEWRIWEGHRRAIPALDKSMDSAPKLNPGRAEPRRILSRARYEDGRTEAGGKDFLGSMPYAILCRRRV